MSVESTNTTGSKLTILTAGGAGHFTRIGSRPRNETGFTGPASSALSSPSSSSRTTTTATATVTTAGGANTTVQNPAGIHSDDNWKSLELEDPTSSHHPDDDHDNPNGDRRHEDCNADHLRQPLNAGGQEAALWKQSFTAAAGGATPVRDDPLPSATTTTTTTQELVWLVICFLGIMASFVCYGLLLEYTTSGGRQLHELSFLFVTSGLYTLTAAAGRYVRDEEPTTIPPARFAVLGVLSMGSTFCSVRSLRYVIFPIQVLAKSCKPVPVMLMGAVMGKRYPAKKYINVFMIVLGVALFMGGGESTTKKHPTAGGGSSSSSTNTTSEQIIGALLLFISLCFDGGTGAYEDKLMSVHSVQPFDLMYNIQLGKTILAGVGLLVLNQIHIFVQMCQDMGFLLVALGLSGALGQVFIFVTIAKFGALTCSIIGLARKVTTLVASIYFYGHHLTTIQSSGLLLSIAAMVMNFWGKTKKPAHGSTNTDHSDTNPINPSESRKHVELVRFTDRPGVDDDDDDDHDDHKQRGSEQQQQQELQKYTDVERPTVVAQL